jgi:hypothetical protein
MSAQHPDYLQKILTAQVYDVAIETPLDLAPNLSARIHNKISFKREDMQPVFSFKLRGAYNKMATSARRPQARGDLRLGRQPRPGRRPVGQAARRPRRHRDAHHHPGHQDRRGQAPRRRGGAGRRKLFRRLRPRQGTEKTEKLTFVHPTTTRT